MNIKQGLEWLPIGVVTSWKTKDAILEIAEFIEEKKLYEKYELEDLSRAIDIIDAFFLGELQSSEQTLNSVYHDKQKNQQSAPTVIKEGTG